MVAGVVAIHPYPIQLCMGHPLAPHLMLSKVQNTWNNNYLLSAAAILLCDDDILFANSNR